MKHGRAVFIIVIIASLAWVVMGCSPKVDTSSGAEFLVSLKKVAESVPKEEQAKVYLAAEYFKPQDLEGKTGQQILEMVKAREIEILRQTGNQADAEIKELEEKSARVKAAQDSLAMFEVLEARLYSHTIPYGWENYRKIKVRNGTPYNITMVVFWGALTESVADSFNYVIPGGLQPGAEVEWTLTPGQSPSRLDYVKIPKGANLILTTMRLSGDGDRNLFSTERFSKEDVERLEALRNRKVF